MKKGRSFPPLFYEQTAYKDPLPRRMRARPGSGRGNPSYLASSPMSRIPEMSLSMAMEKFV